jgi:hypothetical protein
VDAKISQHLDGLHHRTVPRAGNRRHQPRRCGEAIAKHLGIAAFISLPSFPLGVDAVRLQRVANAMLRFKLLPAQDQNFKITSMIGS